MIKRTRYHIAEEMQRLCASLKLDAGNILRRAGLPRDYFDHEDRGLFPHQIFALWDATTQESKDPNLPVTMGKMLAHGAFSSLVLAFTCSKNVAMGFERIALFKPLIGPIMLQPAKTADAFTVTVKSTEPGLELPKLCAAMDLVFFVELIRTTTAEHVVPIRATVPKLTDALACVEDHIGTQISVGPEVCLEFEPTVADLRLITENPSLWSYFEQDLTRRLDAQNQAAKMSTRVKSALYELLPSGQSSADATCAHLHLSKRSLQRHLKAEGTSFQSVLDATRSELSLHYLRKDDLSVEEISYLLAYRDPNSFYRAFQSWTGMTPAQARQSG